MNFQRFFLLISTALFMLFISCGTESNDIDENERFEDGILTEINELLGEELMDILENELEMPIHRGDSPPDINSSFGKLKQQAGITFLMSPTILLKTNVPQDEGVREPGSSFSDGYIRFSNQSAQNYTIDFDLTNPGDAPYVGDGSYIIGQDNRFSVFGILESVRDEGTVITMNIFSGILTEDGISEPHYCFFMVDNGGVSGILPNGTGRSFEDADGFAVISAWPDQAGKHAGSGFYQADWFLMR